MLDYQVYSLLYSRENIDWMLIWVEFQWLDHSVFLTFLLMLCTVIVSVIIVIIFRLLITGLFIFKLSIVDI